MEDRTRVRSRNGEAREKAVTIGITIGDGWVVRLEKETERTGSVFQREMER